MRYAILTIVETRMPPNKLVGEIRSQLEFDAIQNETNIETIIVLTEHGKRVAAYVVKDTS